MNSYQLSVKTDETRSELNCNSEESNAVFSHYVEENYSINSISINDLNDIEKDLSFLDKVALVFLLYGHQHSKIGLHKLLILSQLKTDIKSRLLFEWANHINKNSYNWKEQLLEALCIAKIENAVKKLQLNFVDLTERYSPSNPETNLFIHPIIKCLYILSEKLATGEHNKTLINFINKKYLQTSEDEFFLPNLILIHFLCWINRSIIVTGDWNTNNNCFADVTSIIEFLTKNNILCDLNNNLKNIVNCLNSVNISETSCKCKQDEGADIQNKEFKIYKIRRPTIGYILIINQKEFLNSCSTEFDVRCGTDYDRDRLRETFITFGYTPIIKNNLIEEEMEYCVEEVVKNSRAKDSLIIAILSHGVLGTVLSTDGKEVSISKIKNMMASRELKYKPKMLIIQACQIQSTTDRNITPERDCLYESLDLYFDMIVASSTIPGNKSYRHTIHGSWYIQTLCDIIEQYGNEMDVTEIFTYVNNEFIQKIGPTGEKMVPHFDSTLTKRFYLKDKIKNKE